MAKPKLKAVPTFESEEQEREFWATHDSSDYFDWSQATRPTFPRLRPTLRTISIRLPEAMIGQLKVLANKRDIPYQSLLKQFLAERLQVEQSRGAGSNASLQRTRSARR